MDPKEKATKLKPSSRRRFLKQGAVLAGLATVGGVRSARGQKSESRVPDERSFESFYGVPSHFENNVREIAPNQYPHMLSALTPHQDSVGIITPSGLHFLNLRNHDAPPSIDPQQHRLLIPWLGGSSFDFHTRGTEAPSFRLPDSFYRVPRKHHMARGEPQWFCARIGAEISPSGTAQQTHGLTCSEWTGVPLSLLLKEAGVKKGPPGSWRKGPSRAST